MAMMQGQQQQPQQQGFLGDMTPEEAQAFQDEIEVFDAEDLTAMGFTAGDTPEALKARIAEMLDRIGVMAEMSNVEKQELSRQIDLFVQALIAQDFNAANNNPVSKMLEQFNQEFQGLGEASSALEGLMDEEGEMLDEGQ